jgi:hypothetical protein
MSAWKPCLIALGLGAWLGTSAAAQGVVPGGWSPQFTYQSFVGPGAVGFGFGGTYPGFGYGTTLPGLSPYNGVVQSPYNPALAPSFYNSYRPSSQAVNAVDPLIGAIRQSTRRKSGR